MSDIEKLIIIASSIVIILVATVRILAIIFEHKAHQRIDIDLEGQSQEDMKEAMRHYD